MRLVLALLLAYSSVAAAFDGIGSQNITVYAAPNLGPARTGTVTIAGQTLTVTQASGCVITLGSTSASFPVSGGTGSVSVSATDPACPWTATSSANWITVSVAPGKVSYSVQKNNGNSPARTGKLTIGGNQFTVSEAGRK